MDAIYQITRDGKKNLIASTSSPTKVMTYHKLELRTNNEGSMSFMLPLSNSMRHEINPLMDEITFERNGRELFRGCPVGTGNDILNSGEVRCVGALSYFRNVTLDPYEFSGSINNYLKLNLDAYNAKVEAHKRIYLGVVTVTDSNDYIVRSDVNRSKVYNNLMDKLVKNLGGYMVIRVVDGVKYLDYVAEFQRHARQKVKAGYNIIDFSDDVDYQNVVTVLVPQGFKDEETGHRVDVSSVNNDSIYVINEPALAVYGWREGIIEYDDVTLPENLLRKALALSDSYASPVRNLTINAVDMSKITDADCFYLGDIIETGSDYHDIAAEMVLTEQDIYALSPESEVLVLGTVKKSYMQTVADKIKDIGDEIQGFRKDNWNVGEQIRNAKGLYPTVEQSDDGSEIIWLHDKPNMNDSMLIINVSTAGLHVSPDGGANYYGLNFDGDSILRLLKAAGITADDIVGGSLKSQATDAFGNPMTALNLNEGDTFKFGPIIWVSRDNGNVSLKWVGGTL